MKASPNTKAITTTNDRPPRVVAAGKSNAPHGKGSASFSKGKLATKQPTNTGSAKRPQYL